MKQELGGGAGADGPAFMSASRLSAVLACRAPSIGGAARRSDEGVGKGLYRPPRVRRPVAHHVDEEGLKYR